MIGKISIGASFYGCISYCLEDKKQGRNNSPEVYRNRAEVLHFNNCFGNKHELAEQFSDVRRLNRKVEKPVLHVSFRLPKGEVLDNRQWMETVEECARTLGFSDNQYIAILHRDTGNPHLHIVANRVGYDGKVAGSSGNFGKVADLCRRLEKHFGLGRVPSSRLSVQGNSRREALRLKVARNLDGCHSLEAFIAAMKADGIGVIRGRGISFIDDRKVRIKGSEIGFPLARIERILDMNAGRQQLSTPNTQVVKGRLSPSENPGPKGGHTDDILAGTIQSLMQHEGTYEPTPHEFKIGSKKKKKKKQGPNL